MQARRQRACHGAMTPRGRSTLFIAVQPTCTCFKKSLLRPGSHHPVVNDLPTLNQGPRLSLSSLPLDELEKNTPLGSSCATERGKLSVTSAWMPFQQIWTPIHNRMKAVRRTTTLVPVVPNFRRIRSA